MDSLKHLNNDDLQLLVPEIGLRSILRGCIYQLLNTMVSTTLFLKYLTNVFLFVIQEPEVEISTPNRRPIRADSDASVSSISSTESSTSNNNGQLNKEPSTVKELVSFRHIKILLNFHNLMFSFLF